MNVSWAIYVEMTYYAYLWTYSGTYQLISYFPNISEDFPHTFLTLFISDDAFVHPRELLNFSQLINALTTVFDVLSWRFMLRWARRSLHCSSGFHHWYGGNLFQILSTMAWICLSVLLGKNVVSFPSRNEIHSVSDCCLDIAFPIEEVHHENCAFL